MTETAMRIIGSSSPDREKDDFYPTPPEATQALLDRVTFEGGVWECACGDGAISSLFEANGHNVVSTDLVDRGYGEHSIDFLMEWQSQTPNIVTNPPFKLATQFVEKALSLTTGKVALLVKLTFLEGIERKKMFENTPLEKVLIFSYRLSFNRGGEEKENSGGGMMAFAWFIWNHEHKGSPTIEWI